MRRPKSRFARISTRKRYRKIGPKISLTTGFVVDNNDETYVSWPISCSSPKYSRMEDEVGPGSWHPVVHFRARNTAPPQNVACPSTINSSKWIPRVVDQELQAWDGYFYALTQANDWLQTAAQSFSVQFREKASLGVFLGEMRGGIKEVLPTLEDLRHSAAGNFLKLKFGIEPFIRDLQKMCDVWGPYKKRFLHLRENLGNTYYEHEKHTVQSYAGVYEHPYILTADSRFLPPPPNNLPNIVPHPFTNKLTVTEAETKFIVTALITNEICDMDNVIAQADAFGRVVGLGNSPRVVWNLLPWAWMVDWFSETDKLMDQFELQSTGPFDGQLLLRSLSLSVKQRLWGSCDVQCDEMVEPTSVGNYLSSLYMRQAPVTNLGASSSFLQPSLTGSQSAILAALLLEKSRALPGWAYAWRKLQRNAKYQLRTLSRMRWEYTS